MNNAAALDELLDQNAATTAQQLAAEFAGLADARPLVLFGAGPMGRLALAGLRRAGQKPLAFSDNNRRLWGTKHDGVSILPPDEAVARYQEQAVFVVTVYNPTPIAHQLRQARCRCVTTAIPLFRAFHESIGAHGGLDRPDAIFQQRDDVRRMLDLWADEESRTEYLSQLQWRTTPGFDDLPRHRPPAETYFDPGLISAAQARRFVDCGAFNGDTLGAFFNRFETTFDSVTAFEPDPDNFVALQQYVAALPAAVRDKVQARQAATGSENARVRFEVTGTKASNLSGQGSFEVESVKLDDALHGWHPTFIKMDIEGAEPATLAGAGRLLAQEQPALTVCVYHQMEHLWTIPLLIHELNPDYKLYLRRYAEHCWELVCYALPPAVS